MSETRIREITSEIDQLALQILGPLRSSKKLDVASFERLKELIVELTPLLKDQDSVPRILTGNLWFIFTSILTEAEYAKNRQELELAAWGLQDKLRRLLGPVF